MEESGDVLVGPEILNPLGRVQHLYGARRGNRATVRSPIIPGARHISDTN